jgi:hypothetical protein
MKRIITGFAFILASAGLVLAQTSTGTIQGTVFDPSHALVSGAQVTVTELQTTQTRSQTSTRKVSSSSGPCHSACTAFRSSRKASQRK